MSSVVGRLLANQMPQILLRIKRSGWTSLMRWRRVCGLRSIPLGLSLCAILLNKSSGDGRPNLMRIMKQAKYSLKAQVEKDEGPSGEGQSPRVEKDEGPSGEG